MIYKKLNIKLENNDIRDDLHRCYYLSKPIIRALNSSLIKTINKFNHNMISMLEQHENHFSRLDASLIINNTKWVYENYNLFPNEQYFNRRVLNVTLPCYAIDVNFVNIETFTKDLTKTLVGCNIIEGSGANYKTASPIDIDEPDIKWLEYDIDRFYTLIPNIPCSRTQEFIRQILSMIKQNTNRYIDIKNIVKKMSKQDILVSKESLDVMKNYFIFSNLSGLAKTFCNPTQFFKSIDTDNILSTFLEDPRKWDIQKINSEGKQLFNNIDSKIDDYFHSTISKLQVIDKYKLITKLPDIKEVNSNYNETLQSHPLLSRIKHWSVIPDSDIKMIKTIIATITTYRGKKLENNIRTLYVSSLHRLIEVLEYYKLGYDNQIWEHIGCKEDILSIDPIRVLDNLKFGKV